MLTSLSPVSFSLQFYRILAPYFMRYVPAAIRRQVVKWIPHAGAQKMRSIAKTMEEHSKLIFSSKMAALKEGDAAVMHQIGEGKDILSILSQS